MKPEVEVYVSCTDKGMDKRNDLKMFKVGASRRQQVIHSHVNTVYGLDRFNVADSALTMIKSLEGNVTVVEAGRFHRIENIVITLTIMAVVAGIFATVAAGICAAGG